MKKLKKIKTMDKEGPITRTFPAKDIDSIIEIVKQNCYGKEEFEACSKDEKLINNATAYGHSIIVILLGGKLD